MVRDVHYSKTERVAPLTSLRFFCFRMAKRKRAMALSLLGDMAAVEASVVLMRWVVEMKMRW